MTVSIDVQGGHVGGVVVGVVIVVVVVTVASKRRSGGGLRAGLAVRHGAPGAIVPFGVGGIFETVGVIGRDGSVGAVIVG